MTDRFYIGTAEALEAEYGVENAYGDAFLVYQTWNDEPVAVEGFATLAAAKRSLAEIEDRSTIEYL